MATFDFSSFPVLRTDRLMLRKLQKTDTRGFYLMRNDPEVSKYIDRPNYKDLFEASESIDKLNHGIEHNQWIFWAVSDTEGQFLGTICIWNLNEDDMVGDIGFELAQEHQKKGYMKEAMEAVILYGFKVMKLKGIWGFARPENTSSVKLLELFDFVKEQTIYEKDTQGIEVELSGYLLSE